MISLKALVLLTISTVSVLASPILDISNIDGHPSNLFRRDNTIWCGAIKSGSFKKVSGQWKMPKLHLRNGQDRSTQPNVPIWVGIDGYGCNGLLQAGTTSFIHSDGSHTGDFWVEFFPEPAVFQGMTIHEGDSVVIHVTANSLTSGSVTFENHTQNQSNTVHVQAPDGVKLCHKSAEWIVEWPSGAMAGFSDFVMTATATTSGGQVVHAKGATAADVHQNNVEYCRGSVGAGGNVKFVDH